jgi:hypothetical protein
MGRRKKERNEMPEWMKRFAANEEEFRRECWWASTVLNGIYEQCEPGWRFESALAMDNNWRVVDVTVQDISNRTVQKVFKCDYNNGEPIISGPSGQRQ